MRKAYEENPQWSRSPQRVRVKQIVVKTEEEAEDIRRRILTKKLTFEEAAQQYSIAPEGQRGGDLGYFSAEEMPPFFAEKCFNLHKGYIDKPVSSAYGYHLLALVDRLPERMLPLEDVQEQIKSRLFEQEKHKAEQEAVDAVLKRYLTEDRVNESMPFLTTRMKNQDSP